MRLIKSRLILVVGFALVCMPSVLSAQDATVNSPGNKCSASLWFSDKIYYSVSYNQKEVVPKSAIGISVVDHPAIGVNPRLIDTKQRQVNQTVVPVVSQKRSALKDFYNETVYKFAGNYSLVVRAFDNGIAYRWVTDLDGDVTVADEKLEVRLSPRDGLYYAEEESFYSHNERKYIRYKSADLGEKLASLPALIDSASASVKLWISEADLFDYPGMWVRGANGQGLNAVFPHYPAKEEQVRDRDLKVTERADYLARTSGKRQFPWRVFAVAARDAELLDNQLVYLLSDGTKDDFSWVKPGKVPWDWWNANNVYGVNFRSGVNTATYKYYIDFAAKYGLEYLILDEGWSKTDDLTSVNPDIDMAELLAYAKKKNVGVILWVVWLTLDKQFDGAFDQFEKWGVRGLKVDFMQRDDQKMVNYYERVAREAARRKMLVDFHGAYKPTGMERKYPNVISREGVKGLENDKWSKDVTPSHDLDLPFIRMVAGPMDFTPGAMINAGDKDFKIEFNRPMSQGTRCHQLAMYVIYESPLQMLADSPSNYLREPEAMEFLGAVPSVWNNTVAIDGKVGEYAVMARQKKNGEWFLGAMTDWTPREMTVDLGFLGSGEYNVSVIRDGTNAGRIASDFEVSRRTVTKNAKLTIQMASGGGFVARFVKKTK